MTGTATADKPAENTAAVDEHRLGKVPLTEMADWVRSEADRLLIWASITDNPQHKLWMKQRAHVADMTARTLELLKANEKRFVDMVRSDREAEQRRLRK